MIPMEGVAQTKVVFDDSRVAFLTIVSKSENGMRVMDIRSTFSVANCTDMEISCAPVSFLSFEHLSSDPTSLRFVAVYSSYCPLQRL